jgi:hypothetical protein
MGVGTASDGGAPTILYEMTITYGVLSEHKCEKCEGSIPDGVELSDR